MDIHKEIDTRGLNCPLPILKAKKALADMLSGQLLKVVATDPGSTRDFQAFAKQTGNELVEQKTQGDEFIHVLRRRWGAGPPKQNSHPGPRPGGCFASGRQARAWLGVPQSVRPLRYSRKPAPTSGCCRASSTVASRKPSLLPQS